MAYYIAGAVHGGATRYHVYSAPDPDPRIEGEIIHRSNHMAILSLVDLRPGDSLLFRAGDVFHGCLHRAGLCGSSDAPIIIGRFGDGPRPLLDGAGAFAAVWLENPSHVVVEGLEITNAAGSYGVYVEGRDAGRLSNVTIQDVEIHDVFAAGRELDNSEHYGSVGHVYKYMGGIHACIKAGGEPTWWDGFTVRRSYIHDVASCGISMDSAYRLRKPSDAGRDVYPSVGVVIEDNILRDIAKDGAIIKQVDRAIIQHNQVSGTGAVSTSNGFWYYDARRSVIRWNEGFGCLAPMGNDGGPFSIDNDCQDCEIVENYSHDNEGPGFMLFGRWGTGRGCVARANVSYNDNGADASLPNYSTENGGWGSVTVIGPAREMLLERNVVVAGPNTKHVLAHHDWGGRPVEVRYSGNRFCGAGSAGIGPDVLAAARFEDGNVFEDVRDLPPSLALTHAHAQRGRPFAEDAASAFPYGPRETSFRNLLESRAGTAAGQTKEKSMRQALDLKAYDTLEERVRAVQEDGFVYFPAALSSEEVATLRDAMDRLTAIPESFDRYHTAEDSGFLQAHVNNAFNRDPLFLGYLDRPDVVDLAEAIHGEDCHVIGMTSWLTGPGRPDQTLHIDWLPLPLPEDIAADPRVNVPVFITTTHYYLDDVTEELGPTTFVPGSHRSGRSPNGDTEWKGQTERSILCKAGDAVSFRSEVWHRGTANVSDTVRHLLQVHYAHRMITQKFPPYLNRFQFDEAILAQASPRQRRLMGDHRSGSYD